VHQLIDVVGRNAGFCRPRRNVQHFTRQPTDLAHALLLLLVQHRDLVPVDKYLLGARYAILGVIGKLYALRDFAARR
jgi:hypothetical protein